MIVRAVAVLCMVCGALPALAAERAAQVQLVRAARMIDPESGAVTEPAMLRVEDGRIAAVGRSLPVPEGAQVLDFPGATLVPGYFDCHTHLAAKLEPQWDGEDFLFMALNHPTAMRALEGAAHARQMLVAGFTTVRDLGNGGERADLELARALKWELVPGPTMLASGRIIAPYGGQFLARAPPATLQNPEYAFADSRDELRRAIRENAYYGADLIKVVVDAKRYAYSEEDLRFVVEEAGRAGMKVAAHTQTPRGAHAAALAGVASIEHGFGIEDRTLALMKQKGIFLVSTPFTVRAQRSFGASEAVAQKRYVRDVERTQRAHRAGVPQAFGTDLTGVVPDTPRGAAALEYVRSYLDAGMTWLEVLRVLTTNAARLTGLQSQRGALKPGLAADLVLLDGDPREDATALMRVKAVVKDGRRVSESP